MAVVYLGQDLLLGRTVAVKAVRPEAAASRVARARFQQLATAAAGLEHPNIVSILDVGEERGTPYAVMEYVPGESLREVNENEGPFAPEDVAALLDQVSAALDHAHVHGVVHQNLKPSNILVESNGISRVVDFGAASVSNELDSADYAAPEQANRLMPTPSSDIYSLGVIAYEMLTGSLPFTADTAAATAMRHVHEMPLPPSSLMPGIPPAVDSTVLRALEKDPARRFSSAGSFAEAMSLAANPAQPLIRRGIAQETASGDQNVLSRAPRFEDEILFESEIWPFREPFEPVGRHKNRWARAGVGLAAALGLAAVIFFGFLLAPRLADLSDDDGDNGGTQAGAASAGSSPTQTAGDPTSSAGGDHTVVVSVPNLSGLSMAEARATVLNLGLLIELRDPVYSDTIPANSVAEQDPPASTDVARGTSVVVKLSRGSANASGSKSSDPATADDG